MHLVVFDVDGTLVESEDFDGVLYAQAIRNTLKIDVDEDWSGYRHQTDSGILNEVLDRNGVEGNRSPGSRLRQEGVHHPRLGLPG